MALNPLLVALQGFGFPLSPIALAVQGLIEQIIEEARRAQIYGGRGAPRTAADLDPFRRDLGEPLTREYVESWDELVQLRHEQQRERAEQGRQRSTSPPQAATSVVAGPPAPLAKPLGPPAADIHPVAIIDVLAESHAAAVVAQRLEAQDDEEILLLLAAMEV